MNRKTDNRRTTDFTLRGRDVAAIVPMEKIAAAVRQQSPCDLLGTGKGLWGRDSCIALRRLRDEWNR